MIPWIMILIAVLIILLVIIYKYRNKKKQMDFKGFFTIGLVLSILGILQDDLIMWRMGILFLILGLYHKDFKTLKRR